MAILKEKLKKLGEKMFRYHLVHQRNLFASPAEQL
jgi:hypothetical protein